jgi:hypothetical protein
MLAEQSVPSPNASALVNELSDTFFPFQHVSFGQYAISNLGLSCHPAKQTGLIRLQPVRQHFGLFCPRCPGPKQCRLGSHDIGGKWVNTSPVVGFQYVKIDPLSYRASDQ